MEKPSTTFSAILPFAPARSAGSRPEPLNERKSNDPDQHREARWRERNALHCHFLHRLPEATEPRARAGCGQRRAGRQDPHHLVGAMGARRRPAGAGGRVWPQGERHGQGPPDPVVELSGPGVPGVRQARHRLRHRRRRQPVAGARGDQGTLRRSHGLAAGRGGSEEPASARAQVPRRVPDRERPLLRRARRDRRDGLGLPQGLVRRSGGEGRVQEEVQARARRSGDMGRSQDASPSSSRGPTRSDTATCWSRGAATTTS